MKPRLGWRQTRHLLVVAASVTLILGAGGCAKRGSQSDSDRSAGGSGSGINVSQTRIEGQPEAGSRGDSAAQAPVAQPADSTAAGSAPGARVNAPGSGSSTQTGQTAQAGSVSPVTGAPAAGSSAGGAPHAGSAAPAGGTQAPAAQVVTEHGCFSMTFKHVPTAGHSDNESCARHRNVVTLAHKNVNPSSVCVRVGNTPVKFEKYKPTAKELKESPDSGQYDRFVIGTYAGPHTQLNVRYCLGKDTCNEDCKIPKDEFMAAIGAREDDGGPVQLGHWQKGDEGEANAKLNQDLRRSLASFEESGAAEMGPVTTFKGWQADAPAAACGK